MKSKEFGKETNQHQTKERFCCIQVLTFKDFCVVLFVAFFNVFQMRRNSQRRRRWQRCPLHHQCQRFLAARNAKPDIIIPPSMMCHMCHDHLMKLSEDHGQRAGAKPRDEGLSRPKMENEGRVGHVRIELSGYSACPWCSWTRISSCQSNLLARLQCWQGSFCNNMLQWFQLP